YPTVNIGGQDVQQKAFMGVKLYAVNQTPSKGNAERIAASYQLAQALTSKDSQNNQFTNEDRHIIPANKEVQASEAVQKDALAQAVITMGSSDQYTTVMPKLSQMSVFWTESAALMSDAYNGKIKEDQFLTKLQQFDKDLAAAK
ncbi:MAG: extracellular solute-binding protein, partial [Streptococcus sp.]